MSHDLQEKAKRAVEALADLQGAALSECGFNRDRSELAPDALSLAWRPDMSPDELAEEAMRAASECVSRHEAFRSGRVYCYACGSADCAHVGPESPGQVFTGYQSTGLPRWEELFNFLLQLGDPRTELLFAERPEILARVVGRRRLVTDQLTSFGKNSLTYRVWGELVAGYFNIQSLRAAMTVQLVETKGYRLHLQVVTDQRVHEALANAPADGRSAFHRVYDALAGARRQVFSLSNLWQASRRNDVRDQIREKSFAVLRHLAHSIERKGRQRQRRTVHAEVRGQQMRPIHKAHDDLANAPVADFFRDTVKHSLIVLGKGGRMHAFSQEGKHITSMIIKGDELERRRRRRRFLPLDPEAVEEFRSLAIATMPEQKDNQATGEDRNAREQSAQPGATALADAMPRAESANTPSAAPNR